MSKNPASSTDVLVLIFEASWTAENYLRCLPGKEVQACGHQNSARNRLPLTWSGVEATIIVMCKLDVRVEASLSCPELPKPCMSLQAA